MPTQNPAPTKSIFATLPGETPRAYGAFMAFFELGHARTLPAVADKLGEGLPTVRNWSSKFDWSKRIQDFNSGILQEQAQAQSESMRQQNARWSERVERLREQEWNAAQKLHAAACCFLESYGDEQLAKMTLAQVSRALSISSQMARSALSGAEVAKSTAPEMSPTQLRLLADLKRAYGQDYSSTPPGEPANPAPAPTPAPTPPRPASPFEYPNSRLQPVAAAASSPAPA